MSKLDDILMRSFDYQGEEYAKDKQDIKNLMLELIGEDAARPESGPHRNGTAQAVRRAGNNVKAELRKKVEEL